MPSEKSLTVRSVVPASSARFRLVGFRFGQKRPGPEASLPLLQLSSAFLRQRGGTFAFPAGSGSCFPLRQRNFSFSPYIRLFFNTLCFFLLPFFFPFLILPSASVPHPPVLPPTSAFFLLPLGFRLYFRLLPAALPFYFSCFPPVLPLRLPLGFRLCCCFPLGRSRRLRLCGFRFRLGCGRVEFDRLFLLLLPVPCARVVPCPTCRLWPNCPRIRRLRRRRGRWWRWQKRP